MPEVIFAQRAQPAASRSMIVSSLKVPAQPYPFPLDGFLSPADTALLVIDMQGDFCAPDGYMDRFGFDLTALRRPIPFVAALLAAFRQHRFPVIHTRETFSADLHDVQPHRLWRGPDGTGVAVGDEGPLGRHLIRGAACWEIIPELAPERGELVLDKPAYGAFSCTDIDRQLRSRGVTNLVMTGLTSDCCIHTNVREALDRGYDCLTVSDATGACYDEVHDAAIRLLIKKSGVFGAACDTDAILSTLDASGRHVSSEQAA